MNVDRYRHLHRIARAALIAGIIGVVASDASAQRAGDANCDGRADESDIAAVVVALVEGSDCAAADTNGDGSITAADLVQEALLLTQPLPTATVTATRPTETATATATPTGTPTVTPPVSPTPTATFVGCPADSAEVLVSVDNQTGVSPISVTLSGRLLAETCRNAGGFANSYTVTDAQNPQSITGLAPGRWVHTLTVPSPDTGQRQHQASLLLASAGPNRVRFTAFASVFTVRSARDETSSGTLRSALTAANTAAPPVLIQFDEAAFPSESQTAIMLGNALPALSGSGVTLDGTDAAGATGNRVIDAGGKAIGALLITGVSNSITGMRLRNAGANNRDVLSISGVSARGNLIEHCVIEQAASADGIDIGAGAGADFLASANVVRDSEISGASDKGIKVTTNAYARLENNWVHDNANGAIQATLSGHVFARDNLAERSIGPATAQNGLSVNGPAADTPAIASELIADGNIVRFNAGNGISVRGLSIGFITNGYLSANAADGIRVFEEGQPAAAVVVEGTAAVCNAVDGAAVADTSQADFGGGPFGSAGNNAFTQNNLPGGNANLRNSTGRLVYAQNAQWEHCGRDPVCTDGPIAAFDLSDHAAQTIFTPAQAHRAGRAPQVSAVRPNAGAAGELLRIFGSGFNVVDGHAADATCPDVASRNRCVPLRGNCVRIGDVPAPIEAVTPTMLVVRLPVSCVAPQPLTVQTQGGGTSTPLTVCTNGP